MDSSERVNAWFASHTFAHPQVSVKDVVALKRGRRVSAILPSRNEETTLPMILSALDGLGDLLDEVLVIDSRSTDRTAELAEAAGATVLQVRDDDDSGKGGALRLGVARMTGDVGVFLDADVVDFDTGFPVALLHTLLSQDDLLLVKGFYDRPWGGSAEEAESRVTGGGRVTELVARPLIARRAPLLAGFAQPLAGEVAFVREALVDLPFVSGYGVDIALLLGVLERRGLDAMAQVDLGVRLHGHQELDALGSMALQVAAAFDIWLGDAPSVERLRTTVRRDASGLQLDEQPVRTWLLGAPSSVYTDSSTADTLGP